VSLIPRLGQLAFLLSLCIPSPALSVAAAAPAHLVADLNPGTAAWDPNDSSYFHAFTSLGDRTLFLGFLAGDVQCGLWATDGTAAGTARLADLCAESLSVDNFFRVQILGASGSIAFLSDSVSGLWRTDGTAAGTFRLGATVSMFGGTPFVGPGGILYFSGCDAAGDCEPWRSDGTVAGTRLLRAVLAGARPDTSPVLLFAAYGNRVVFSGIGPDGPALWITDGTAAGTRELARFPARVGSLLGVDGAVYVSTIDGFWSDVWLVAARTPAVRLGRFPVDFRSAGVSLFQAGGRVLFRDPEEEAVSLWEIPAFHRRARRLARFGNGMGPVATVGDRLIFAGAPGDDDDLSLWVLGPRMSRPRPLRDCPGGCPTVDPYFPQLGVLGGRALFAGLAPQSGGLWETDGTGPGTRWVKDLCLSGCGAFANGFTPALGRLLFIAGDRELWVTDGTTAGTVQLGRSLAGLDLAAMRGRVIFDGLDDLHGSQPWLSDLTAAGTAAILTLDGGLAAGSAIQSLTPLGSGALLSACGPGGRGLWGSDGTAAGTILLPVTRQACDSFAGRIVLAAGLAFLSDDDVRIWRTDGTPDGTFVVHAWDRQLLRGSVPLKDRLLSVLDPEEAAPQNAWTFWRSDGTAAGTVRTGAVELAGSPDVKAMMGGEGGAAFFVAQRDDPSFDYALWRTDGTTAGTRALLDLEVEQDSPSDFFGVNGKTVFVATGTERRGGRELWVTDGTAAGTAPVISDPDEPGLLDFRSFALFQGDLYFYARTRNAARPQALWRTDGTDAFLVADFPPASDPSAFFSPALTAAGDFLFFCLDDGVHGEELWRTDGTAAGTVMVKDVAPGAAQARPQFLTAGGGRLYFTATDGEHGLELWTSDGTATGTKMVQDVFPGPASSWPRDLAAADGNLFFTANDGEHGRELWVLPLAP